MAANKAKFHLI